MKTLQWMTRLKWLGLAASILIIAWWALVFYFVSQQTGDSLVSFLPCLVAPTNDCNMLRSMAWMRGINPFEPLALWWSLTLTLLAGFSARALRRQQQGTVK